MQRIPQDTRGEKPVPPLFSSNPSRDSAASDWSRPEFPRRDEEETLCNPRTQIGWRPRDGLRGDWRNCLAGCKEPSVLGRRSHLGVAWFSGEECLEKLRSGGDRSWGVCDSRTVRSVVGIPNLPNMQYRGPPEGNLFLARVRQTECAGRDSLTAMGHQGVSHQRR